MRSLWPVTLCAALIVAAIAGYEVRSTTAYFSQALSQPLNLSTAPPTHPPIPAECAGHEWQGATIVVLTEGDDVYPPVGAEHQNNGKQIVFGLGGNDHITGGNGKDCLVGGEGDDTLVGGNSADVLLGGPGNDTITGGNGPDYIDGGPGTDACDGGSGPNTILNCEPADDEHGHDNADNGKGKPHEDAAANARLNTASDASTTGDPQDAPTETPTPTPTPSADKRGEEGGYTGGMATATPTATPSPTPTPKTGKSSTSSPSGSGRIMTYIEPTPPPRR